MLPSASEKPPDGRRLSRRFWRLTLLNILANLSVPMASMVDTAILGRLAELRFLAGVALAGVLFEYLYWSFGFLRMGTTGTTAQALGRGDREESFTILHRAVALGLSLGLALLILQRPLRELGFLLLGGDPSVELAGRAYFDGRIWGAPAAMVNFAFLGWYLGREESGRALMMTVVGNLANVALDYLFIVKLGLAAFGAGLATSLSQYLMLATGLAIFLSLDSRPRWSRRLVLSRTGLAQLLRLNRDILIRTVALISAFALFTNSSALLGATLLAANAVLLRYLMLSAYLVDGIAFACESLAGAFLGQGDRPTLRKLRNRALATGALFSLPFALLFLFVPQLGLRLLTDQPLTLSAALPYAGWLAAVLLVGSQAYVFDGLFLGLTAGTALRNSMLLSFLGCFVPLAAAAVHWQSNHLLWLALLAFMAARTLTLGWASRRLLRTVGNSGDSA